MKMTSKRPEAAEGGASKARTEEAFMACMKHLTAAVKGLSSEMGYLAEAQCQLMQA